MFCVHCGREMAEDEKFCPFCGEKVDEVEELHQSNGPSTGGTTEFFKLDESGECSNGEADLSGLTVFASPVPSQSASAGGTAEFEAPLVAPQAVSEPTSKKKRGLIAAIAAAAAVLLLVIGVGVFALGPADAAEVSTITRIMPKDESGEPLTDYTAVVEAEDGTRYETQVSGSQGFTYNDFGNLAFGNYQLVIINNYTNITYGPYVTVLKDVNNGSDGALEKWDPVNEPIEKVENPSEGDLRKNEGDAKDGKAKASVENNEELKKAAYAAYYEKCREYMDLTGGTVGEERYYEDLQNEAVWCAGLNMVDLVDFNQDGIEELVLVYYDESVAPGPGSFDEEVDYEAWQENYAIEVWEYQDDALSMIHEGPLSTPTNLAIVDGLCYFNWDEKSGGAPGLYFIWRDSRSETMCLLKYQDGGLVSAKTLEWVADDSGVQTYFIDGDEVSQGDYEAVFNEASNQILNYSKTMVFNSRDTSHASDEDESGLWMSYEAVREMTMENIDFLREEAGVTEEVAVSDSSDDFDEEPSSDEYVEEEPHDFSVADYAGEYEFVEAEGMYLGLTIGSPGEDTWLLCWHDPEMASDADFNFALEDGVTSYVVTDNRNTSGDTEYQFDFVFGDGWVDVTVTRIYDEYEIVPEGTFTFWKK